MSGFPLRSRRILNLPHRPTAVLGQFWIRRGPEAHTRASGVRRAVRKRWLPKLAKALACSVVELTSGKGA
jgi:hypothetical protein